MTASAPGILDGLALAVLFLVLPAAAVAQGRLLTGELVRDLDRPSAYVSSTAMLALLGVGTGWLGLRLGGTGGLGLDPMPVTAFLAWTAGLTGVGLAVVALFRGAGIVLGAREHPVVEALLPRTGAERGMFVVLALAAGTGEELAYRGYAFLVLVPALGPGGALALTSGVFGVLHAYQGALGMARAATLGVVLGAGFLVSGSLWPPMAAHALLDLLAGLLLGRRLMVPEPHSRV